MVCSKNVENLCKLVRIWRLVSDLSTQLFLEPYIEMVFPAIFTQLGHLMLFIYLFIYLGG